MSVTGERLRTLREERGLLQREVAKEIGIDRLNYGKYERGQVKSPRKITELAAFFGVSSDYLYGLSETRR